MKNKLFLLGILVVLGGVLFLIFGGKTEIKNYPPKDGPIVAFGDSLVFGIGSTEGKNFVSLLSAKIGEPIVNLGVSGDTTEMGLARINQVLEQKPRVTILLLGGNDFLRKLPREQTFANLRLIIKKLQDNGSVVLLLGVRGGLLSDSADNLYEDLASETGSAHVPNILSGLFADARYMFDGIHPNNLGYEKIADKVYPVLKGIIR